MTKPAYTTVLLVENDRLVRRDAFSGLEITGNLYTEDLRIGGVPHKDYPTQPAMTNPIKPGKKPK